MREGGGNCVKFFKKGWNRKEGRGNKKFSKRMGEGKLGQGLGALKRGGRGLEPPHELYPLFVDSAWVD